MAPTNYTDYLEKSVLIIYEEGNLTKSYRGKLIKSDRDFIMVENNKENLTINLKHIIKISES